MENNQPQTQAQTSSETPPSTDQKPVETPSENPKVGRPALTPDQIAAKKKLLVQKIEPYLRSGLSVNKALHEAQISKTEFYEYMSQDEDFRDQIDLFRQFVAVIANSAIVTELQAISKKQNGYTTKEINKATGKEEDVFHKPVPLTVGDRLFIQWFALNSNLTKDEYGERKRIDLFDPEAEIQKIKAMLDQNTTEEIDHSKEGSIEND